MTNPTVSDETIRATAKTGLSPSQIAYRLHISPPRVRRVMEVERAERTPLQYRTDILYRACQDNGGCSYGSRTIRRYDHELPVCRRCGVPVEPGKARMSVWRKAQKGAA